MTTQATKRVCRARGCGTILRSTNPDPWCGVHIDPRVEQASVGMPRKGSQRRAILETMPGTAVEIHERIGGSLKSVRSSCRDLVIDGLARREKIAREGRNGPVTRYVRVVSE